MSKSNIKERCIRCEQKVPWVILSINLGVFLIEGVFALISNCRSLTADAIESFATLIIALIVLYSLKISKKENDEKHPYGYGKIEFLASGVIYSLLLMGISVFIYASIKEMITPGFMEPPCLIAVFPVLIAIAGNYIVFKYCRCAGEKLHSPVILANSMINKTDIMTSCLVLVAVIGSNLGWVSLDHIIAVIISLLIVKTAVEGMIKSARGLIDYSPKEAILQIRDIINRVPGVKEIKDIKTRLVGRKIWVDLDLGVPGNCILGEGLKISEKLKYMLKEKMSNIVDVTIRLSPVTEE
ncbi:MAG: cation transporter [Planctomycetes bacterium]|nr:cation transporter [Planctomycetota bacterium]